MMGMAQVLGSWLEVAGTEEFGGRDLSRAQPLSSLQHSVTESTLPQKKAGGLQEDAWKQPASGWLLEGHGGPCSSCC